MSHELKEGVELQCVQGPFDNEGEGIFLILGDSDWKCSRITVVEQCGQMGMVPWAKCERNNGEIVLVNLALMESVVTKAKDQ